MPTIGQLPTIGPLLASALEDIDQAAAAVGGDPFLYATSHVRGTTDEGKLPVVAKAVPEPPEEGEAWAHYRERTLERLAGFDALLDVMGVERTPLVAANAFQLSASTEQIRELVDQDPGFELLELDPLVQVTSMDNAGADVGLGELRLRHPDLDGRGVRVAVLDSGIDVHHPCLAVADSVTTSDEPVELPGSHGTHCAGSIASRDEVFGGVAPGATLINVKVLRANGSGRHTFIVQGVDAALDREANVLSMSLGFNHLPTWSEGGHGWTCPDGRCALCTAVDNAVRLDGVAVVVAAGNEHERAEALRGLPGGGGPSFDTELGCPGQAKAAITVGAVAKSTFLSAPFSSRGPTSYGLTKPDIVAPGVNITSTIPIPHDASGAPDPAPERALQFGRKSGTSMATPIVAGAVALIIQKKLDDDGSWTTGDVRQMLLGQLVQPLVGDASTFGRGRLVLDGL